MNAVEVAKSIHIAASDKKAVQGMILNVTGQSDLCDYVYICSADNEKQAQAIAESIDQACKKKYKLQPSGVEGKSSGTWVLIDYGQIIVHIFQRELREYYRIEELFPNAPKVQI